MTIHQINYFVNIIQLALAVRLLHHNLTLKLTPSMTVHL